jgi:hypothetical protein
MSKPMLGILLGAGLGLLDGLTALMYPEARPMIMGILIGSTIKGMIAGVIIGFFAYKVRSISLGVGVGLMVGFVLAYLVAAAQQKNYLEIMVPGSLVGVILGYATQRYGKSRQLAASRQA